MKRLVCMLLISAMALSLVACKSKPPKEEEASIASVESIVIDSTDDEEEEGNPEAFIALWQYKEYPSGYAIYEDGTYELFTASSEDPVYKAEWEMTKDSMVLYNTNGFEENSLSFKPDGTLVDDTDDVLIKCGPEGFKFDATSLNNTQNPAQSTDQTTTENQYTDTNNQYYGDSYNDQNYQGNGDYNNNTYTPSSGYVDYINSNADGSTYTIRVYDDSSFELIQNGQVTSEGYCNSGEKNVDLYFNDGTHYNSINFNESGDITDSNGDSYYVN